MKFKKLTKSWMFPLVIGGTLGIIAQALYFINKMIGSIIVTIFYVVFVAILLRFYWSFMEGLFSEEVKE